MTNKKISQLPTGSAIVSGNLFAAVQQDAFSNLTTYRISASQILDYITGSTFNSLSVINLSASYLTASSARVNDNLIVGGDLAVNGGDITSTASTLNINAGGTVRIQDSLIIDNDLAVNGGDLTTTQSTFNLLNTTANIINLGGQATQVNVGASSGITSIKNNLQVTGNVDVSGDVNILGKITAKEFHTSIVSSSIIYQTGSTKFGDTQDDVHQFTGSLYVTGVSVVFSGDLEVNGGDLTSTANTLNINPVTSINLQKNTTVQGTLSSSGNITTAGDLAINSGNITSTASTLNINAGGTVRIEDNLVITGTINSTSTFSSSGNITTAGDLVVNGGDLITSQSTFNLLNTTANTINLGGQATEINIGSNSGITSVKNNLQVTGNVDVTGDVNITGKVTAKEFHTSVISSSIIYQTGSTKFGDTQDDVHQITGSLFVTGANVVLSGDLAVNNGNITSNSPVLNISASTIINLANDLIITGSIHSTSTFSSSGNITTAGDLVVNGGNILSSSPVLKINEGNIVSGTVAQFVNITASFNGDGNQITNITASNISSFINDVRNKFTAGTGIVINSGEISASNIPNSSLQYNSIVLGSTNIQLGETKTIIQGLTQITSSEMLIQGNLTVNGTASIAQLNTLTQTSLVVGDKYITILSGGVDHTGIDGAGFLWGTSSGPGETTGSLGEHAHILYDASRDALQIFPGLYVTGSTTLFDISGTVSQFSILTASIISASTYYGIPPADVLSSANNTFTAVNTFDNYYVTASIGISASNGIFDILTASVISASTYIGIPPADVLSGSNNTFSGINTFDNYYVTASIGISASNGIFDILTASVISASQYVGLSAIDLNYSLNSLNSDTTLDGTYGTVLVNATSSNVVVTLPSASNYSGVQFVIKRTDTSPTNLVTVSASIGDLIDGYTHIFLDYRYEGITVQSDGINGWIINSDVSSEITLAVQGYINPVGTNDLYTYNYATPEGPNKSVQFNKSGFLTGAADFIYDSATSTLVLTNAQISNLTASNILVNNLNVDNLKLTTISSNFIKISTNYDLSVNSNTNIVLGNAVTDITASLPAASSVPGRHYTFKKIDSSDNIFVISCSAGDTIDGEINKELIVQYETLNIISDGTSSWFVL